jgi:PAS domain S-box-containing protein
VDEQAELDRQLAVARRLRASTDAAARLVAVRDIARLAQLSADAVVDDLGLAAAEVWLADGEGRLRLAAVAGGATGMGRVVGDVVDVETGATLVADAARTRLPVVLNDVGLGLPFAAAALTPILLDDELQAVLVAWSDHAVPVETADVLAAFAAVVAASFNTAGLLVRERTERERLAYLAEATALLGTSLDWATTLRNIESLALARLADRCEIRVVDDDDDSLPPEPAVEGDALVVPLLARGRRLGSITLRRSAGYGDDDVTLARELARRAALALDNARLYRLMVQGEQRFRSFVDGLGAVLWEADAATLAVTFVNQRAEELLGYPLARWLGDAGFLSMAIHPDDRTWVLDYWSDCVDEGHQYDSEFRMTTADGRTVWMRCIVYVVDDRLVGLMVDVTERRRFEDELQASREQFASLARTLQESLLPPHLPEMFGMEVAARYRPAGEGLEVGGDFYDLFEVGDEGWGVVMGDVCGKGAEAAALTALTRYTVRALAIRERVPSRVLRMLNQAVLAAETGERFCTALYALLVPDGDGIACTVACGGHPLPLVLRADGTVDPVGRAGTLLGLWPEVELHDEGAVLGPGDALVLYTDGAVEARTEGEQFGSTRLRAVVAGCVGLHAREITDAVVDAVTRFEEGRAGDDLAVVVLRVPG